MGVHLILAAVVPLFTRVAAARPTAERLTIKGYQVHLVDVPQSNRFGFALGVPYGSADDSPPQFGLAHLFEHMFSRGSRKFPGANTIVAAATRLGFVRNAGTGPDLTLYFGTGGEDHGLEMLETASGGLDELELLDQTFDKEHGTVTEEIVTQAPNRPQRAIAALPFMVLPPADHPLRGHFVGDHATLAAMSKEDVRALHQRIYHAGNVRLVVVGNFSSGLVTREAVIAKLEHILPTRPAPAPYLAAPMPPAFAKDAVMNIVVPSERSGLMFLPVDPKADLTAVRTFLNTFSSVNRNSAEDIAKRELGWATSVSASLSRYGSLYYALVSFRMTPEGYAHREEFAEWLLRSLELAQSENFRADIFTEARLRQAKAFARLEQSVPGLVQSFTTWMFKEGYDAHLRLDWAAVEKSLHPERALAGARALSFDHKAIVFMGADATDATGVDDLTKVKYAVKDWVPPREVPAAAHPGRVETTPIELKPVATEDPLEDTEVERRIGRHTFVRASRAPWVDRTVLLRFNFPKLTALELLSLRAWLYAAEEELTPELNTLRAEGVGLDFGAGSRGLRIKATGDEGKEMVAIEWLIEYLRHYTPDPNLIERFRADTELELRRLEDGFAGSTVTDISDHILSGSGYNDLEIGGVLSQLSSASIADVVARGFAVGAKTLIVAGPSRASEVTRLLEVADTFAPTDRAPATLATMKSTASTEYLEKWQRPAQSGVGLARVFRGPSPRDERASAAFGIIASLMHTEVFPRARPFGYVQAVGAEVHSVDTQILTFHGQTADLADAAKVRQIWDDEIARWASGAVTLEEIERGRQGAIARLSQEVATSAEGAGQMLSGLDNYENPFRRRAALERARTITIDEIRDVARRFIASDRPSLVVIKGPDAGVSCEDLLRARATVRAG